jgi:hypothetical protein
MVAVAVLIVVLEGGAGEGKGGTIYALNFVSKDRSVECIIYRIIVAAVAVPLHKLAMADSLKGTNVYIDLYFFIFSLGLRWGNGFCFAHTRMSESLLPRSCSDFYMVRLRVPLKERLVSRNQGSDHGSAQ